MAGCSQTLIGPFPRIAVQHCGSGAALIFLHGVGGNRTNWAVQLNSFSLSYHAIAWDMRGYGRSDDYEGPLQVDDLCADLRRVLDHFEADRAHLVGLSLGGFIIQEFYRRHPERVRSLTLANTNAGPAVDWSPGKRDGFLRMRRDPLAAGLTPAEVAPQLVKALVSDGVGDDVRRALTDSIAQLRSESFIKALERVVEFNSADVLPSIACPTLLIGSLNDPVVPIEEVRRMRELLPRAQLVELPGAHLSNIEQPDAFNRALASFLRDVP